VTAAPVREALLEAWFAQNHGRLTEAELLADAAAQLRATPSELTRLAKEWRARHASDPVDASDAPVGTSSL
jgi:hypothetical protein